MTVPAESARRLAVVLSQAELDRCSYDEEGAELLRTPGVWLLSNAASHDDVVDPLIRRLDEAGLLIAGNVLLQMPTEPNEYEPVEDAQQRAAERKHLCFTHLCQLLGATQVRLEVLETESNKGDARVEFSGGIRSVHVSGEMERKTADSTAAAMTLDDRYEGGEPDPEAAAAFLARARLTADPLMRSLVDSRRSKNTLKSRRYTVDLSRESTRQLTAAAQLKVPGFITVKTEAAMTTTSDEKYRATYEVSFA